MARKRVRKTYRVCHRAKKGGGSKLGYLGGIIIGAAIGYAYGTGLLKPYLDKIMGKEEPVVVIPPTPGPAPAPSAT